MKKLFIATAVLCSMAVMASSLKNETVTTNRSTLDMRVYQDTPPRNKKLPLDSSRRRIPTDSSRVPWPDSAKKTHTGK